MQTPPKGLAQVESEDVIGPLVVAALLRGHSLASLKHRVKKMRAGSHWRKISEIIGSANGNGADKLEAAFAGIAAPGWDEATTRRHMLASIARFDPFLDDWLSLDPEFIRRSAAGVRSVRDISTLFGNVHWVWEGWIPRGYLSMLCGKPGAGKSYIAAWVATALAVGGTFPDGVHSTTKPSGILWLDTEGTHSLLLQRLRVMAAPLERFYWPLDPKDPEENFPAVDLSQERWISIVRDIAILERPQLIVIDSLRGAHKADENSSEVQDILGHAASLARDLDCAVLFIHHLRKAGINEGGEIDLDRVRGSSAITAMMRVVIALDRPDPARQAERMRVIKSNLGDFPDPVGVFIDVNGPHALPEPPLPPRAVTAVERAREFLMSRLQRGPQAAEELFTEGEAAGISRRSLVRAKSGLGIVVARIENRWEWALPANRDELEAPF